MDRYSGAVSATLGIAAKDDPEDIIARAVPFFPVALMRKCSIVSLGAGQVFYCRSEAEGSIHCLLRGDVSVQREIMGVKVTLQRAVPGDWLIEPQLNGRQSDAIAVCKRKSMLLAVPASALNDSLDQERGFARAWCAEMAVQVARHERRVERLSFLRTSMRIAHYLATESAGGCGEMILPFQKKVWAAHLGISPESLSRGLSEMIVSGILEKLNGNRYRLLRLD